MSHVDFDVVTGPAPMPMIPPASPVTVPEPAPDRAAPPSEKAQAGSAERGSLDSQ